MIKVTYIKLLQNSEKTAAYLCNLSTNLNNSILTNVHSRPTLGRQPEAENVRQEARAAVPSPDGGSYSSTILSESDQPPSQFDPYVDKLRGVGSCFPIFDRPKVEVSCHYLQLCC